MLGKLTHYAFDAILVSTVIAGVRRSSGYSPVTSTITDPTTRGLVDRYLSVGETVFEVIQASAMNSAWFKRDNK
jgi:hypothetical protein